MSPESPSSRPSRISREIDSLCDAFEAAFRRGDGPRIEDYLPQLDGEYAEDLFRELLEIEIDIRQQQLDCVPGETITGIIPLPIDAEAEYRRRFPEYAAAITDMVRKIVKPRRLGDYELLREIGHGGMGVVYRAVQKYLNQIVAIKVLPNKYLDEPQAVTRFRREMLLIGGLNHPNIVRALNAGEHQGSHYLVMEFVEGTTVQQLLDRAAMKVAAPSAAISPSRSSLTSHLPPADGSRSSAPRAASEFLLDEPVGMPIEAACEVVRQAALGLAHVHRFGLVHRDMKPANLMIDRDGVVKILDLGLGKFSFGEWESEADESALTKIGTMMGTTDYMAPEQWEDSMSADIRSDIYSLGCTFYFMLTGLLPFGPPRYDTQRKKMVAHLSEALPNPELAVGPLPPGLTDVYRRMTAKEPARRFQTPEELAVAMEPYADVTELLDYSDKILDRVPGDAPDSLRRRPSNSRGNRTRFLDAEEIVKRRKRRAVAALGGLIVCILTGLIAVRLLDRPREVAPPAVTPIDSREVEESRAMQLRVRTAGTDLAQLPGLNGTWWFNEIPWYLPFLREAIDRRLSEIATGTAAPQPASVGRSRNEVRRDHGRWTVGVPMVVAPTFATALPQTLAAVVEEEFDDPLTAGAPVPSPSPRSHQPVPAALSPVSAPPTEPATPSGTGTAVPDPKGMEAAYNALLAGKPDAYYDPNLVAAYAWLWNVCRECRPSLTAVQWRLVEDLKKLTDSNLSNADHAGPVQEAYDRFIVNLPKDKPLSATNLHTKALLMHRLANLRADRQLAVEAGAVYADAIAAYDRASAGGDRTATKMYLVCQSDLARSLPVATGQYDKSLDLFQQVYENISALAQKIPDTRERRTVRSDLFYIDFLAVFADTATARGAHRDDQLERALRIVNNNPKLAQRTHPLTAHLTERMAWSRLDQWKVHLASTGFQDALRMRETIFRETVHEPGDNPMARFYIFHARHGLAMSHRYQGNTDRALEEYDAIIKEIDAEIARLDAIPEAARFSWYRRYRESLLIRSGNTCERRGDCVLFGGAASGAFPTSMLTRAATDYETARERGGDCNTRYVMFCKSAIVASLLGKCEEASALLEEATEESRCALGNIQRGELVHRVAEALHLSATDPAAAGEKLRTLLRQFLFDLNSPESTRRETLEIRLFCTEYLVAAGLKRNDAMQASLDAENLDVIRSFGDRSEMRPYMRRYFDLAIRAGLRLLDTGDADRKRVLGQIARLIWWMRSSEPKDVEQVSATALFGGSHEPAQPTPPIAPPLPVAPAATVDVSATPPTLLLFHFTQDPQDGFALFFPRDGRDPRLFPLAYTRSRIREALPLDLPGELIEAVEKERHAGPGIRISWSDTICWARPTDAFGNADWPFANQLPLIEPQPSGHESSPITSQAP